MQSRLCGQLKNTHSWQMPVHPNAHRPTPRQTAADWGMWRTSSLFSGIDVTLCLVFVLFPVQNFCHRNWALFWNQVLVSSMHVCYLWVDSWYWLLLKKIILNWHKIYRNIISNLYIVCKIFKKFIMFSYGNCKCLAIFCKVRKVPGWICFPLKDKSTALRTNVKREL